MDLFVIKHISENLQVYQGVLHQEGQDLLFHATVENKSTVRDVACHTVCEGNLKPVEEVLKQQLMSTIQTNFIQC